MTNLGVAAPPGPTGYRWSGNLPAYEADRLGFLLSAQAQFGDVVAIDANATLISSPRDVLSVLQDRSGSFAILGDFLGRTLTPRQAADTLTVRRHLSPGLRPRLADEAAALVHARVTGHVRQVAGASAPRTLAPLQMFQSALSEAVAEFYFGPETADHIASAVGELLHALEGVFGTPFALPAWAPTPRRRRIVRAHRNLQQAIRRSVEEQKVGSHETYAAGVIRSCEHAAVTPARSLDLLIGSLLAAHTVPAAGAAWCMLELARRPALQASLTASLRIEQHRSNAPGGSATLVTQVILETLRLHPPTWMLRRTTTRQVEIGGYRFGPGQQLLLSPYVIHRDPRVFRDPLVFQPDRWHDRGPQAYLPFGAGLHACPGGHLGMVLISAALSAVLARWTVSSYRGGLPDPRSTLVPRDFTIVLSPPQGATPQAETWDERASTR